MGEKKLKIGQPEEREVRVMSKLLTDTKQFYYDFMMYDEKDGDYFARNPKAEESYKLSVAEKHFVKRYMSLIMNTGIVSDSTKEFIRYYLVDSTRKVVKSMVNGSKRDKKRKELNENTVLAMIQYDSKKLQKYFDDDMLEKIKDSTYKDISVYEEQLNLAIAKFGKASELKEHLVLDVPLTEICGKLSDSDFKILLDIVKPYSKGVMKQLIEIIPDNMKAYLNYLLYVEEKSQLDQDRYEKLKNLLINGVETGELEEMQKKLGNQTVAEVSVEKEVLEEPKVERTEADIKKEEAVEETQSKKEFNVDFSDNGEDELIELEGSEKQEVKKQSAVNNRANSGGTTRMQFG